MMKKVSVSISRTTNYAFIGAHSKTHPPGTTLRHNNNGGVKYRIFSLRISVSDKYISLLFNLIPYQHISIEASFLNPTPYQRISVSDKYISLFFYLIPYQHISIEASFLNPTPYQRSSVSDKYISLRCN